MARSLSREEEYAIEATMPQAVADPEAAAERCQVKIKKEALSKAVKAILQIVQKRTANSNPLFEENTETVQLQFTLSKIPERRKVKPLVIPLPNPLYNDKSAVCFISKDPQKTYKELLIREKPLPGLTKVIGVDKLRRNYKEPKDKNALADSFDLFLCDATVAEMMPRLLGKNFLKNKRKIPIPVRMNMESPHPAIQRAMNGTPLRIPQGPCLAVKIGRSSMEPHELEENAAVVISKTVKHMVNNPVMSICIKATDSLALPIWRRPKPDGKLTDLKRYRSDASSAASETGTGTGTVSDLEGTGDGTASEKGSDLLMTSDAGETLSTHDSFSEVASSRAASEIDSEVESQSGLDSAAGDVDEETTKPSKEDLPLVKGLKKKRKLEGKAKEEAKKAEAAASMAPPAPKKRKKAA